MSRETKWQVWVYLPKISKYDYVEFDTSGEALNYVAKAIKSIGDEKLKQGCSFEVKAVATVGGGLRRGRTADEPVVLPVAQEEGT